MYPHELEDQVSWLIQDCLLKEERKESLLSLLKHWEAIKSSEVLIIKNDFWVSGRTASLVEADPTLTLY